MIVEKSEELQTTKAELEHVETVLHKLEAKNRETEAVKDQLLKDLQNFSGVKEALQRDNAQMEQENEELTKKLQNVLTDSKSAKTENKELRGRIQELERKLSGMQITDRVSSPVRDESTGPLGYSLVPSPISPGTVNCTNIFIYSPHPHYCYHPTIYWA